MQRHRQSTAATLQVAFTDELGEAESRTTVTVGVTRANGEVLIAAGTPTAAGAGVGVFKKVLTPAQTSTLDTLTATWHDGDNDVDWITQHRIVGGFMFTIAQARAFDDVLADEGTYPSAVIAAARSEVENDAEWICDRAFVPSYDRVTVDGDGSAQLMLGRHDLRRIRSVRVYESLDGDYTDLTAGELSSIALLPGGVIRRTDGGVFRFGSSNVVVELEYGLDAPEDTMVTASLLHLRSRLNITKTGVPDRARELTTPQGNTYRLNGAEIFRTGIDAVDAVYDRFSLRAQSTGNAGDGSSSGEVLAASQTLSYDPQWYGLFRGGRR